MLYFFQTELPRSLIIHRQMYNCHPEVQERYHKRDIQLCQYSKSHQVPSSHICKHQHIVPRDNSVNVERTHKAIKRDMFTIQSYKLPHRENSEKIVASFYQHWKSTIEDSGKPDLSITKTNEKFTQLANDEVSDFFTVVQHSTPNSRKMDQKHKIRLWIRVSSSSSISSTSSAQAKHCHTR